MLRSLSKADGISMGGGAEVMPAEKALGNLRPLMRWKPRSPVVSCTARDFLFLKTPPRSGASTGAVLPPRSDMPPAPPLPRAASAPVNAFMPAMRFRYQRRKIMAVRTKTASPATPPTMPPASTEGGGVSSLLLFEDEVLLAELEAVAVGVPPIKLASGL
jgi:hypothetical protein